MRIEKPCAIIMPFDAKNLHRIVERAARTCYRTEGKMKSSPDLEFIRKRLDSNHLSVIEHEKLSVIFQIDRGVSHELVRHRIGASYSQESTRYCNYSKESFGEQISLIFPFFLEEGMKKEGSAEKKEQLWAWNNACETAEKEYFRMLRNGATPQEARSVLPNSLKTEVFTTFNLREWRHFFELRADSAAHPQMRQVAIPLLFSFKRLLPVFFDDIPYDEKFAEENKEHLARVIIGDWDDFIK